MQYKTYAAYHEQLASQTQEDIQPIELEHPVPNLRPQRNYGYDPASAAAAADGDNNNLSWPAVGFCTSRGHCPWQREDETEAESRTSAWPPR